MKLLARRMLVGIELGRRRLYWSTLLIYNRFCAPLPLDLAALVNLRNESRVTRADRCFAGLSRNHSREGDDDEAVAHDAGGGDLRRGQRVRGRATEGREEVGRNEGGKEQDGRGDRRQAQEAQGRQGQRQEKARGRRRQDEGREEEVTPL